MPEIFALRHIRKMDFNHRQLHGCQGVPQSDARVAETAGVDHYRCGILPRLLNQVDEHTLVIGLVGQHLHTLGLPLLNQLVIDLI